MGEYEVVGCQMKRSFNLLAPADKFDVVYLNMVSFVASSNIKLNATFAIRVLSILG